jgi:hypothetical protein
MVASVILDIIELVGAGNTFEQLVSILDMTGIISNTAVEDVL